jgi:hypothetical protein
MFLEHYPRITTKRETIGTNSSRSRARKLDDFKFLALAVNYSGRTKYSAFVSKLIKLSEKYLSLQKTQKAAVFLIVRSSAGK